MAARRYFRKGEAELPKGGAWKYRGTQVVTGAEARKVVAEEQAEAARAHAADELLRSHTATAVPPRAAFSHEPAASPPSRPAATTGTAATNPPVRPASSRSGGAASNAGGAESTPGGLNGAESTPGGEAAEGTLLRRVRRVLGLG